VEVPPNEFNGFHLSEMSCHGVVMVVMDDLEAEVLLARDVEVLPEIQSVTLVSPASQWFHHIKFLNHHLCKVVIHSGGGDGIQDGGMVQDVGVGRVRGCE